MGKWLIAAAIVVVVAVSGFLSWERYDTQQKVESLGDNVERLERLKAVPEPEVPIITRDDAVNAAIADLVEGFDSWVANKILEEDLLPPVATYHPDSLGGYGYWKVRLATQFGDRPSNTYIFRVDAETGKPSYQATEE